MPDLSQPSPDATRIDDQAGLGGIQAAHVSADIGAMKEGSLDGLRAELALLEAQEEFFSARRRHLHNQIDFGYATEDSRTREQEVSAERQRLHRRIDELRELLSATETGV
jgi:hypothetical protein